MKNLIAIIALLLIPGVSTFAQKLDRSKRPEAGPAPEIKLAEPASFELSNGLKVFVVENHKLPKVSFSMVLDLDPIFEGDIAGYTGITGQLLSRGTKNRSKQEIDETIDFMGARLSTSPTSVSASSLKKHQLELLEVMSDVIMNAEFKQEELDKIKKQEISNLATQKNDPDEIASNLNKALVYGKDHPYGEIITEKTLEKITLEDCKNYYNTYFRPNVGYLAVVGDITVEEVKPLIEKYFGSWEKGDVPSHEYKMPEQPKSTEVAFVAREGAEQSVVTITYPVDLKTGSPEWIKARLMNAILGAGMTGRLFLNLREKHGYTYGAYSSILHDELVGYFLATAKVRNEVTDSSITQFMVELNRLVEEKVTEKELQAVKNFLTGNFAYTLQMPQTIARFAISKERYNLQDDYYTNYLKRMNAVTVEDIQAMAKKYIQPSNAHIIVVGNEEVIPKLGVFGKSGKVNRYDYLGYPFEESVKAVPAGVTAKTVVDQSILAKYGLPIGTSLTKKLSKIKDVTMKMTSSINGQEMVAIINRKAPNKFANTMSMGTMMINKQTFNGTTGKISGMQGERNIEGKDLEELKVSAIMHADTKYDELGMKFNLLGMETLASGDAYKLEMVSSNGSKETQWYDVASGHQVKSLVTKKNEMGVLNMESNFSNFKEVNGIVYPHTIVQSFGPQKIEMNVVSIDINTKLGDDLFE